MLKSDEEIIAELKRKIEEEKNNIAAKELALYYLLKDLEKLQNK